MQLFWDQNFEGANKQDGVSSPEPLRMYVQYSGGQLPYYAQPAQYQPATYQAAQPAYVSGAQPVQSIVMPQQYPATYSGFSGGTYVQGSPSPYGQPQFAQYGQLQAQAQPQPQYAQLQYPPQMQPQVPHALQSGMEGAGQVPSLVRPRQMVYSCSGDMLITDIIPMPS